MRTIKLLIFTAALVISLAGVSFGQEMTGSIEGTVKDPQGNVVPGVTVTLQGISLGFNRTTTTDNLGRFSLTPDSAWYVQVNDKSYCRIWRIG